MIADNTVMERRVDVQAIKVQKLFFEFLRDFAIDPSAEKYELYCTTVNAPKNGKPLKYFEKQVDDMKVNDKKTLYIDFAHLVAFDKSFELREAILSDFYRYTLISVNK